MAERRGSVSGLTDEEAQEFHQYWMQGFVGFTAVAVVASHPAESGKRKTAWNPRRFADAPDRIRTCDLAFRKRSLYPLSYKGVGWNDTTSSACDQRHYPLAPGD